MLKLNVLNAEINRVTLRVDLQNHKGAHIYRAHRPSGPYEAVGVAFEETYVDAADLEPGKTYYYLSEVWRTPGLSPEPDALKGNRPVSAAVPRAPKEKRLTLTRPREEFTISLGGHLDESNAVTKGPEVYCPGPNSSMPPYDQVFEPNVYVTIENVGETDVINPRVVVDGRRDWWSVETIAREILEAAGGEGSTETERTMAVWKFVAEELYDQRGGLSWSDDMSDPVKLFNTYGFDGCITNGIASRRLAEAMGLTARDVWLGGALDGYGRGRSCSHTVFEGYADSAWHFLDTDQMVFFLKRDNRTVAGSEDLSGDIDLLRRTHRNLGLAGKDLPEKEFYTVQFREKQYVYPPNKGGVWMDNAGNITHAPGKYPPTHTMSLRLRPGEKLVRYWDNVGKNVVRGR